MAVTAVKLTPVIDRVMTGYGTNFTLKKYTAVTGRDAIYSEGGTASFTDVTMKGRIKINAQRVELEKIGSKLDRADLVVFTMKKYFTDNSVTLTDKNRVTFGGKTYQVIECIEGGQLQGDWLLVHLVCQFSEALN